MLWTNEDLSLPDSHYSDFREGCSLECRLNLRTARHWQAIYRQVLAGSRDELQIGELDSHFVESARTYNQHLFLHSDGSEGIPNCILLWPSGKLHMTFSKQGDCRPVSSDNTGHDDCGRGLEGCQHWWYTENQYGIKRR